MNPPSPQQDFAIEIVNRLRSAGHLALFAGGCVRDALLGRIAKDYDVATTARPDEVRQLFGRRRTLAIGASFGVIMVVGPKEAGNVEVTTFRTEGPYHDGRRPDHVQFSTPEEDAKRRDFTINGMFFDPLELRVLDYVGGATDLAARLIRAIGDPRERFREDKLRMLRAIRFTATLAFSIDAATADAIREMASELSIVSVERITQELKKMLVDRHRRLALELADDVKLFPVIFPELERIREDAEWQRTLRRLEVLDTPSFELALAGLLLPLASAPAADAICRRLKLSNDETERIVWLVAHQPMVERAPQFTLAELKRLLADPNAPELLKLARANRTARAESLDPVTYCEDFLSMTPRHIIDPEPLLTGNDLITLGLRPGPRFKQILDSVRDAQLNLEIHTTEAARAMATRLGAQ